MSSREKAAYRLAKLVRKAWRQMSNGARMELEPFGTSLPVVQIIKRIVSGEDMSQLEVAQELELEPAALCRLVTELEAQDLVTRRRDPGDKRCVLMTATPSGVALLARTQPRVLASVEAKLSRLTGPERGELCRLLEKLTHDEASIERTLENDASGRPLRSRPAQDRVKRREAASTRPALCRRVAAGPALSGAAASKGGAKL